METPAITQELIDYLSRQFPDKCPDVIDTERTIWVNVGAAGVVRHLQRVKEDQEENILKSR